MNEIKIDGLAKFKGVNFTFASPAQLNPLEKFPENELATKGKFEFAAVNASADREFPIGESGDVKFSVGGGGFAAFGVYRKKDVLLNDLKQHGLSEHLANLLSLNIASDENLLAMRWGYNFKASTEGKVALFSSPVNLTFGVDGKTQGLSVLLHRTKSSRKIGEAIRETLESWRTPLQIKTLEDLKEQTTVVFETMGKLDVNLGVRYGYEFNWVRESLALGGLTGDFGLKIELGIAATFGFNTVGNYALALSRETSETLRLQIFKLRENGMTFAFQGGLSGQANTNLPPKTLDEFIKGVFNLNGSQVLKDFEKWTNEETSLQELLGEEIPKAVDEFVRRTTGISATDAIETGMTKLKDVIKKWHALPHEFTSYLYGLLGKTGAADDLETLKEFLNKTQTLSQTPGKILEEIETRLEKLEFYDDPVVKWLTAFAGESVLSMLPKFEDKLDDFNDLVGKSLDLLDGGEMEEILTKLQKEIDERLHLDKIEKINPDKWLRKRLADFLGKSKIVEEMENIKKAINELRKNGEKFYKIGYDALLKKYSFNVNFAYQKASTAEALIDLTFDFEKDPGKAADYLKLALAGDFKTVLTDARFNFVKVNKAVLTHDINRSVHLTVGLPSFDRLLKHVTKSTARGELVESEGDKLWIYTLSAEDVLEKKKSLSRLAIAAQFSQKTGVRTFGEENNSIDYSFAYGKMEVDRRYIEQRFQTGVDAFLKSEFPAGLDYFGTYLSALDKQLDQEGFDKPNEFGNVLAALKVSLPGKIMSSWELIPEKVTDPFYKDLSGVVQKALRKWIPLNYTEDPKKFEEELEDDIYPLLVYSCLPTRTEKQGTKPEFNRAFYWDYKDKNARKAIFENDDFKDRLRFALKEVRNQTAFPGYQDSDVPNIIKAVQDGKGKGNFRELCRFEEELLENISGTINLYLEFRKETKPEKSVERLAEFGEKFVDTFNDELGHIGYTPKGSLRPIGVLLIAEIARLLSEEFGTPKMAAMFELLVLRDGIEKEKFNKARERFKQGSYPTSDDKPEDVVFQQRIVNTGSLPM